MNITVTRRNQGNAHSSPTSVIQNQGAGVKVAPLILDMASPGATGTNKKIHARCDSKVVSRRPRCHESEWVCPPSKRARRTFNPIQTSVDQVVRRIRPGNQRRDGKQPISLANGDITSVSLPKCHAAVEAVTKAALESPHMAGYSNACGLEQARKAIAEHHSCSSVSVEPDHVIVTNGAAGALDLAFKALLDSDSTILLPQPGFPLYEQIARSIGANIVHYRLDPSRNWEVDIKHLESILNTFPNVRTMVVNNPSSPTGAVFSLSHLCELVKIARKYRFPLVADEVYGDLTYGSNVFYPLSRIAAKLGSFVPVMTVSGLSKQFLLPGWRVGWICFHDNIFDSLRSVHHGAIRLAQITHGASSLAQAAIPAVLSENTPGMKEWRTNLRQQLQKQADILSSKLRQCPGLQITAPQGAMYTMIKIDTHKLSFENDVEFAMRLVDEENVFVLPGSAIGARDVIRVAFFAPEQVLQVACSRIESFCWRHVNRRKSRN